MPRPKAFDEQEALAKALRVFWEKGYCATSMQDLVDAMGINRASLYDTYGDKHRLFVAALERYRKKSSRGMIRLLQEATSVREAIRSLLESIVQERFVDNSLRGCFMVNSSVELAPHDDAIARLVSANRKELEQALAEAIARGQSMGEIRRQGSSPEAMARFLFNTINGLRVYLNTGASTEDCLQVINLTMEAIMPEAGR